MSIFPSRRRRSDRLRDRLDAIPPSAEVIAHAAAGGLDRIAARMEGRTAPPMDAAASEVLRAHARARGIDVDRPEDVDRLRADVTARLLAALGHTDDCAPDCRADHRQE